MLSHKTKDTVGKVLNPIGNAILMSRLGDLGQAHRHGDRTHRRVALTFDDGPVRGSTEQVLDVLAEHDVLATFFLIGANVQTHSELARRVYDAGHTVGAHSMHHSRIATVAPSGYAHIDECVATIHAAIGQLPALYRAPWGWMTPWEMARLKHRGMAVIRWDIETPDSLVPPPPAAQIAQFTLKRVQNDSVIVFHDGMTHAETFDRPETVAALQTVIRSLKEQGYSFVTIPEMFGIPGYQQAVQQPEQITSSSRVASGKSVSAPKF